MNRSRAKGTSWESKIRDYLRQWWPNTERLALSGNQDRGDITGIPGVCIEAKAEQRHDLAGWLNEAQTEGRRAGATVSAVWAKRRGSTDPGKAYVLIDGETFARLLREAGY